MKRRLWLALAALAAFAACAPNAPMDTLKPEGPVAAMQRDVWNFGFAGAVVVFFLVEGLLVFVCFRFRDRGQAGEPKQTHGDTRLEIGWTIAPALLLAVLAVPTMTTLFKLQAEPTGNVLNVKLTGSQWWWKYEYEGLNVTTANELHIPVNRPVKLTMTSTDVIHSWWVPKLAGKQDVVPGHENVLTIQGTEPGKTYLGHCTEFCALSHASMQLRVMTHTEADFQAWVREQAADRVAPTGAAAEGERIFTQGQCVNCHAVRGTTAAGTTGPDLTHFASRTTFAGAAFPNTNEEVTRWLRDPPAMKAGSKMPNYHLSDDEISKLVAYLEGLK
jgi:cytochrome c oxidase subunit II